MLVVLPLIMCCSAAESFSFIHPLPRAGHWKTTTAIVPGRGSFSAKSASATSIDNDDATDIADPPPSSSSSSLLSRIEECKISLLQMCNNIDSDKKKSVSSLTTNNIESVIYEIELLHSQQQQQQQQPTSISKTNSNLLTNGVWELIYTSTDITRSSPFFWAFRRAFSGDDNNTSDQIFDITDSIPAPLKMVGPATQTIDMESKTLVSRVKIATLGGIATSIMTTRCDILGSGSSGSNGSGGGSDGSKDDLLRIRVTSTKPEEATIVTKVLGSFLGEYINSSSPPFPSGDVLDMVVPGSSEVVIKTTFCDEGLRITRNADRPKEDVFVWKRVKFGSGQTISL
jgi:hypothetical protein